MLRMNGGKVSAVRGLKANEALFAGIFRSELVTAPWVALRRGSKKRGIRSRKLREKNHAYLVCGSSGKRAYGFAFVRPAEQ